MRVSRPLNGLQAVCTSLGGASWGLSTLGLYDLALHLPAMNPIDVGKTNLCPQVTVLVNNAGMMVDCWDADTWEQTMAINFTGAVSLSEAILPVLADGAAATYAICNIPEPAPACQGIMGDAHSCPSPTTPRSEVLPLTCLYFLYCMMLQARAS